MPDTIMLVDDEIDLLDAITELLDFGGYSVDAYPRARDALAALEDACQLPSLIISDVAMPGMDGVTFFRTVRDNPAWDHIPFLFVSAYDFPITEDEMAGYNHFAFIRKPFDVQRLYVAIESLLPDHPPV